MEKNLLEVYDPIIQILGICDFQLLTLKSGREIDPSRLIKDLEKVVKETEKIISLLEEMTLSLKVVTVGSIKSDHYETAPVLAE